MHLKALCYYYTLRFLLFTAAGRCENMLARFELVSTVICNKGIKQYLPDLVFMHYVVIHLVWRPMRALARIADKSIPT